MKDIITQLREDAHYLKMISGPDPRENYNQELYEISQRIIDITYQLEVPSKPTLGERVSYIEVEYGDLEDLIQKEYGQAFCFPMDQEASNDSQHSFSIYGDIDEYDRRKVESFKETGRHSFSAYAILNDLAARSNIEKGEYLIIVCW